MADLIISWRQAWGQPELPFAQVQLANHGKRLDQPSKTSALAGFRDSQFVAASKLPKTGLVVTIDIGEENNIHPGNKQDVGKRLAAWALGTVYGKDIVYSGPVFESMQVKGAEVHLTFTHTGSGLMTKGHQLKGYAVAGEDKQWHWADARIEGTKVVVKSDAVPAPVAVRYAWADNPECNLYNKEGFPAMPFRSDPRTIPADYNK
ncbi:MAG: sialate O-acetylesterase [Phycisphaerales bacterium]|nr:sialate O-acetylesterase [Phycisphaerales bacterium]